MLSVILAAMVIITPATIGDIEPGQNVVLEPGEYGDLYFLRMSNVTFTAKDGAHIRSIRAKRCNGIVFDGLHVNLENGEGTVPAHLFDIRQSERMTVRGCWITCASDYRGWTTNDWVTRTASGLTVQAPNSLIESNTIRVVCHGITATASNVVIRSNTIQHFRGDGMRALGDYSRVMSNTVQYSYDVSNNHDDGFQSWSKVRLITGIRLVGNYIERGANLPHRGPMQGIGCFGMTCLSWEVRSNVIYCDAYNGLVLHSASNCIIYGNTVLDPYPNDKGPAMIRCVNDLGGNIVESNKTHKITGFQTVGENEIVDEAPPVEPAWDNMSVNEKLEWLKKKVG